MNYRGFYFRDFDTVREIAKIRTQRKFPAIRYVHCKAQIWENRRFFETGMEFAKKLCYVFKAPSHY